MKISRTRGKQFIAAWLLFCVGGSCFGKQMQSAIVRDLIYSPSTAKSGTLTAGLQLSANLTTLQLLAKVKLINTGKQPISIFQFTVYPAGGLQSLPVHGGQRPFWLQAQKDTLIDVAFRPVNNIKLYEVTGKQGHFLQAYKVNIFYKIQGSEKVYSAEPESRLPEKNYKEYAARYGGAVTGYSFNTGSAFADTERDYLGRLKLNAPVFAFLAPQEIALTGLNIWMKSYSENDTLFADFLVVNQHNYCLKIIADSIKFGYKEQSAASQSLVLVSRGGSAPGGKKTFLLEKGEQAMIHFKIHLLSAEGPLIASLKHAFLLDGSRPLFNSSVELLKVRLP